MEKIRVMILADGGAFYSPAAFSLSTVIATITAPNPWYSVAVEPRYLEASNRPVATPAFTPDARDLSAALFDANELLDAAGNLLYDELWLFGLQRIGPNGRELTDAELRAIARFLNAGGGVFATGDHQSMGWKLCNRIPRVRSMRRWWYLEANATRDDESSNDIYDALGNPLPHVPAGVLPAPSFAGALRHDTLTDPLGVAGTVWAFNLQSDGIPQTIRPVWSIFRRSRIVLSGVHPLLCGPASPVTHLPDHAHEGDCTIATDLTSALVPSTVDPVLAAMDEFPSTPLRARVPPVVVAHATVTGGHLTQSPNGGAKAETPFTYEFPVASAYDGHQVSVGRVACDATWHHFFDVNVQAGNFATAPEWLEVQQYWRNLVLWLAPRQRTPGLLASLAAAVAHAEGDGSPEPFGGPLAADLIGPCMLIAFIEPVFRDRYPRFPWPPWEERVHLGRDDDRRQIDVVQLSNDVFRAIVDDVARNIPVASYGAIDPGVVERAIEVGLGKVVDARLELMRNDFAQLQFEMEAFEGLR